MEMHDNKRELVDYFKKNVKKGYTTDSLKTALIQQGYPRVRIEKALEDANNELAKTAPVIKEKPEIKYEIYDKNNKLIHPRHSFFKKIFSKLNL
jgi:SOS response regulatory protein OraA/RecX